MEEKKNKCPLCRKKLVMIYGIPTCPDCGYRDPYRSSSREQAGYSGHPQMNYGNAQPAYGQELQDSDIRQPQPGGNMQQGYAGQPQPGGNMQQGYAGQPQPGGNMQQGYAGQPQPNGNMQQAGAQKAGLGPYAQVVQPSGKDTKEKKNVVSIVLLVFAVIFIAVGGISTIMLRLQDVYDEMWAGDHGSGYGSSYTYGESSAAAPSSDGGYQEASTPSSSGHGSSISHLTFDPPESELLQEFVSQLFDKPAASATREDLNSVIGVEIRDMYNSVGTEVAYELSDGSTGICYLTSSHLKTGDFKCFPNLQRLDLGRNYLDWDTDWHGLASLTELACGTSLGDLERCMDVSQLTRLHLTSDFMMKDFSGMGAFSNLEYLELDCSSTGMELTGLSQAIGLKTLIITDGDSISDFEELYDMVWLKELSIESKGLRDIGFITGMSGLESLELKSTDLKQVAAIADRADSLKCLRLHRNFSVQDYSPVFQCTGLEELELYVEYIIDGDMTMPDLSMMPELKALALGNYERFPGLENMTGLESLTLIDSGLFNSGEMPSGLQNLTNLRELSLIDMSVDPKVLETLVSITSLEAIDMEDTFIWGDINVVFGLPNLKTLNLEDASFGLKLEGMPVSESLQELNMTDANVHRLMEDGSWDGSASNTRVSLGSYTEFFEHMPNLTVLEVPGHELQDVEFAGNLAQLTYLNITNNYVTDLSPLGKLGQLKVILCENNPVHDRTGLKNVLIIE